MPLSLTRRVLSLTTELGEDALQVRSMRLVDAIGRPFRIELQLLTESSDVELSSLIGTWASLKLRFGARVGGGGDRCFSGRISKASYAGPSLRYHVFNVTIRPDLWFLRKTHDCRIFQSMTVPDIIKKVLDDRAIVIDSFNISRDLYPTRDFIVQYRESYFNFISRHMEREGLFYVFKHGEDSHPLVLSDSITTLSNPVGVVPFNPQRVVDFGAEQSAESSSSTASRSPDIGNSHRRADDVSDEVAEGILGRITSIQKSMRFRPGTVAMIDYNYLNVDEMESSRTRPVSGNDSEYEVFEYPGKFDDSEEGDHYATIRLEQIRAAREVLVATTSKWSLSPGDTFTLTQHPSQALNNQDYHVISVDMRITSPEFDSDLPEEYKRGPLSGRQDGCQLKLIPSNDHDDELIEFRSPSRARRPMIRGPQTAVVVGFPSEGGGTSDPDEHGRVKVRFFWDRYAPRDGNDSCWIRVSEAWAGNFYGSLHVPHIGQEVIVEFLEGDPDRPIITGRVYNGRNIVPLTLPAQKTQTVVARDHYGNEILFDATAGDEKIKIFGPNYTTMLLLDKEGFESSTIANQSQITVGNKWSLNVGTSCSLGVGFAFTGELGAKAGVFIGATGDFKAAFEYSFAIGGTLGFKAQSAYEHIRGYKFTSSTASDIKLAEQDIASRAESKYMMCGHQSLTAAGGGMGIGTPTSLLTLEPTAATLAVGTAADGLPAGIKMMSAKWPLFLGMAAGVFGGASATLLGMASLNYATSKQPQDDPRTKADESNYIGKSVEAKPLWIAGGVCGVAGIGVATAQIIACKALALQAEAAMPSALSDTPVAPRLELKKAPPSAALAVGASNAQSAIELNATATTIKFGPANKIVVDGQGVAITVGPSKFTVKPGICSASAQLINLG